MEPVIIEKFGLTLYVSFRSIFNDADRFEYDGFRKPSDINNECGLVGDLVLKALDQCGCLFAVPMLSSYINISIKYSEVAFNKLCLMTDYFPVELTITGNKLFGIPVLI